MFNVFIFHIKLRRQSTVPVPVSVISNSSSFLQQSSSWLSGGFQSIVALAACRQPAYLTPSRCKERASYRCDHPLQPFLQSPDTLCSKGQDVGFHKFFSNAGCV